MVGPPYERLSSGCRRTGVPPCEVVGGGRGAERLCGLDGRVRRERRTRLDVPHVACEREAIPRDLVRKSARTACNGELGEQIVRYACATRSSRGCADNVPASTLCAIRRPSGTVLGRPGDSGSRRPSRKAEVDAPSNGPCSACMRSAATRRRTAPRGGPRALRAALALAILGASPADSPTLQSATGRDRPQGRDEP